MGDISSDSELLNLFPVFKSGKVGQILFLESQSKDCPADNRANLCMVVWPKSHLYCKAVYIFLLPCVSVLLPVSIQLLRASLNL